MEVGRLRDRGLREWRLRDRETKIQGDAKAGKPRDREMWRERDLEANWMYRGRET